MIDKNALFSGISAAPAATVATLGPRIRQWLLMAYRRPRAKRIAADFGVSVKVAGRWLAGGTPTTPHFVAMAAKWGVGFLIATLPEALAGMAIPAEAHIDCPPAPDARRMSWAEGIRPPPVPAAELGLTESPRPGRWTRIGWTIAAALDVAASSAAVWLLSTGRGGRHEI